MSAEDEREIEFGTRGGERLEYLYKEHVRVGALVDSYGRSSFEDFKLLGAIGVLVAWPPLAKSDLFAEDASDPVLLLGLLAILFIVAIIGVRDLLKQSVIAFHVDQLRRLEDEIRTLLGTPQTDVFRYAESWDRWRERRHDPIILRFQLLFIVVVVAFPIGVLAFAGNPWHVAVYAPTAAFVAGVFFSAVRSLRQQLE